MTSVEEALRIVAAAVGRPRVLGERATLGAALGRVLGEDVLADLDAPPFDRATMDGYAVRASDVGPAALPVHLAVTAHVTAGRSFAGRVDPGTCVAIMTGAPIPAGADAVVRVEWTDGRDAPRGGETRVRIDRGVEVGSSIAKRGEQARAGEPVLRRAERLSPAAIGVAAAAGRVDLVVAARPRVAIVATGDELVAAQARPGPTQIRDSNGHALVAQTLAAGGAASYGGPVPDDRPALLAAGP